MAIMAVKRWRQEVADRQFVARFRPLVIPAFLKLHATSCYLGAGMPNASTQLLMSGPEQGSICLATNAAPSTAGLCSR